jgi:hypothetical protein
MPPAGQIFVIGTARSGTTWLGNLLGSHPLIAAVMAPEHHGVHESHLFDHTRYVLRGTMSCDEFFRRYAAEDYFRLTGVERADLCTGQSTNDAVGFFTQLMEIFAKRRGANAWLEKTPKHAIYFDEIVERFPEARFVVIRRSMQETLLSQLAKYARPDAPRFVQIAEKVFRYVSDMRAIRRLERLAAPRVASVRYEDLARETEAESRRLQAFLGLPYSPLASAYEADSSFRRETSRRSGLTWLDRAVVAICAVLFWTVPFRALVAVRRRRDRAQATHIPKFDVISPRLDAVHTGE